MVSPLTNTYSSPWIESSIPGYEYAVIDGMEDLQLLSADMARPPVTAFPWDEWIDDAANYEETVIAVRKSGDATASGFVTFAEMATVRETEGRQVLKQTFDLKTAYLHPEARGKGLSRVLQSAFLVTATDIMQKCHETLADVVDTEEVWLSAESITEEGARFAARLSGDFESAIGQLAKGADRPVSFRESIDYGDWNPTAVAPIG